MLSKFSMMVEGKIIKVSGPLVVASGMEKAKMYDLVRVSNHRLIGEIVELRGDKAYIQVYEDTSGIGVGEPVFSTGEPLSVELGPGLIGSIFDGVQRPLDIIKAIRGNFIARGIEIPALDRTKKWHFIPLKKIGDLVDEGDILGFVNETSLIIHKILVPIGIKGRLVDIKEGDFSVTDTVAVVESITDSNKYSITLMQPWPVRKPRPYKRKLPPNEPLFTGQRVIDAFFPVAKGGTACVPGPFGSGKTVIQHQLAKWADAEIIVYVGCGERGNEMTDVLLEFPQLKDPKSGEPLIKRIVMIANTSNMPVAAREASVYTGITIAEYFRDMGYSVALMADSTSRWAEALREISGRLEEMPGEEGYPAYLPARIAEFYERAGRVICLSSDYREGALSVIGAVSPPGGDLSDPVVQATLKVVKVFWSLEEALAHARHFPAINWLTSYSRYHADLEKFYYEKISPEWVKLRQIAMELLQKEAELKEIVRLVGVDALSPSDQLILEAARSIREDFLYQSAFDPVDTYASAAKQLKMLKLVLEYYFTAKNALDKGGDIKDILSIPAREKIGKARFISESELYKIDLILDEMKAQLAALSTDKII